jgi:hypothetical protein
MLVSLGKVLIMLRRTIISLAAFLIVGVAPIAIASTDAFAAKKAVHHRAAAAAAAVIAPAPVAAGYIDNNYGPVADRIPRCFDSVIFYPYPPCY